MLLSNPPARRRTRLVTARRVTARRERDLGQSVVEFAMLLPVFLLFMGAVLDFGRIFYSNISVANAAREGAFAAAQLVAKQPVTCGGGGTPCASTNPVVKAVSYEMNGSAVSVTPADVTVACSPACAAAANNTVSVSVGGRFQLLTPLLSGVFGGSTIRFHSTAIAQIEYLPSGTTATPPPNPVAAFTMSAMPTTGVAPVTLNVTDTSTGSPTQWQWDFGDGATATTQNATHVYATPGTYTITLTAINITSVDIEMRQIAVVAASSAAPSESASESASASVVPTATPCMQVPDVIGMTSAAAGSTLQRYGFNVILDGGLTSGPKDKIQAQSVDATSCKVPSLTTVKLSYRAN